MATLFFMIGPGGVGKSTVGVLLAERLGYACIDLDDVFCARVGNIRHYIAHQGYESYVRQNAQLCRDIIAESQDSNTIIILSSGFLATDIRPDIIMANRRLVADKGKSIRLLPSKHFTVAKQCIVTRQLTRSYGLNREKEIEKISLRFKEYLEMGDYRIYSMASPEVIVNEIIKLLKQEG